MIRIGTDDIAELTTEGHLVVQSVGCPTKKIDAKLRLRGGELAAREEGGLRGNINGTAQEIETQSASGIRSERTRRFESIGSVRIDEEITEGPFYSVKVL